MRVSRHGHVDQRQACWLAERELQLSPASPSHLAAAWFALEDVHPDAGPLFYYSGSHRCEKLNWGNGIIYNRSHSIRTPDEFASWLEEKCQANGYKKGTLLIEKGDVLIWHGCLVRGGTAIDDMRRTRKSYICHYSSRHAYPSLRGEPDQRPIEYQFGDAVCYEHPTLRSEENWFKEGEKWRLPT